MSGVAVDGAGERQWIGKASSGGNVWGGQVAVAVDQAVGQRREDSRKTELKCAKARRAKIYSEPVGYGANSDGYNVVARVGGKQCMNIVMDKARRRFS